LCQQRLAREICFVLEDILTCWGAAASANPQQVFLFGVLKHFDRMALTKPTTQMLFISLLGFYPEGTRQWQQGQP